MKTQFMAYFIGGPRDLSKAVIKYAERELQFYDRPKLKAVPVNHKAATIEVRKHTYQITGKIYNAGIERFFPDNTDLLVYVYMGYEDERM